MNTILRKHLKGILAAILMVCIVAACNGQAKTAAGAENAVISIGSKSPVAWLDAPLDQSTLPLAPYQIVFHITDPTEAKSGELSINGEVLVIMDNPDAGSKIGTLSYQWNPQAPGTYTIAVRAGNNSGEWSQPDSAVVYIADLNTPTPEPTPTPTPTPEPTEGISGVAASPTTAKIGTCQPNQVTISANAIDPDGIKVVVLFYRFASGGTTGWGNVSMNPKGNNRFERTLDLTSAASALGFGSSSGLLEYQVVIQDVNSNMTRGEVYRDVSVSTCPGFEIPLENIQVPRGNFQFVPTKTPIIIK